MWGRFGRSRTRRSEAVEQAIVALENVRGRFGRSRTRREGRAYGDAVGLGIGVLLTVLVLSLLFWRFRRTARETTSTIPAPEEGVEAAPPGSEAVPLGPPREEPPPGEERPERRGVIPTAPPTLREEPPPGEE
jgi:hypothetical protein